MHDISCWRTCVLCYGVQSLRDFSFKELYSEALTLNPSGYLTRVLLESSRQVFLKKGEDIYGFGSSDCHLDRYQP